MQVECVPDNILSEFIDKNDLHEELLLFRYFVHESYRLPAYDSYNTKRSLAEFFGSEFARTIKSQSFSDQKLEVVQSDFSFTLRLNEDKIEATTQNSFYNSIRTHSILDASIKNIPNLSLEKKADLLYYMHWYVSHRKCMEKYTPIMRELWRSLEKEKYNFSPVVYFNILRYILCNLV